MHVPSFFALLLSALVLISPSTKAEEGNAEPTEKTQVAKDIAGVYFYADWCGTCKLLEPRVEKARAEEKRSEDISFITFDMTDSESIARTKKIAKAEDLDSILQKYGAATGFLVLYDRANQETLRVLTSRDSGTTIQKAFKNAVEG